jgi:hypothetical protein
VNFDEGQLPVVEDVLHPILSHFVVDEIEFEIRQSIPIQKDKEASWLRVI